MKKPEVAERVVLLGFMAAGKSTVGRLLARRLGWSFVDLDEVIVERSGSSVEALFRRGEPVFRAEEAAATAAVAARRRMVLAPGGGWVTNPALPRLLVDGTAWVWLRVGADTAVARARRTGTVRPLLAGPDPEGAAARLLAVREPLYAALAQLVVDAGSGDPETITQQIESWLAASGDAPADEDIGQA